MTTRDEVKALFEAWQVIRDEHLNAAQEATRVLLNAPDRDLKPLDREQIHHLGHLQQADEEAHENWWFGVMTLQQTDDYLD